MALFIKPENSWLVDLHVRHCNRPQTPSFKLEEFDLNEFNQHLEKVAKTEIQPPLKSVSFANEAKYRLPPLSPKIEQTRDISPAPISQTLVYTDAAGKQNMVQTAASRNSETGRTPAGDFRQKIESITPRTMSDQTLNVPCVSKKDEKVLALMDSWGVSEETAELMYLRNRKMKG